VEREKQLSIAREQWKIAKEQKETKKELKSARIVGAADALPRREQNSRMKGKH